ncbi:MAG: Hsp20 family protein [Woeseiaceae bacterium]|nr:Hsp20 family protein [Woeseiaceae bacterium]
MSKPEIQKVTARDERKLPIFDELEDIADRIRVRAFNLFKGRGAATGHDVDDWLTAEREICWPAAELVEEDDEFEVRIALAGFEAEDITVTATPDELIVKASRTESDKSDDKDAEVLWSEFRSNEVYRRIALPSPIDVDKIDAELKRGMLEIEAPKARTKKRAAKKVRVTKG